MKKKYSVNVHYDVVLSTEVIAESESEAIDSAIEKLTNVSLDTGEVTDEEGCVTDVEDINEEEETQKTENPLSEAYFNLKSDLIDALVETIRDYGENFVLETFHTEVELVGSSVDKVLYFTATKDIFVVFNENGNEYANITEFGVDDLVPFVTGLQDWFEKHGKSEE